MTIERLTLNDLDAQSADPIAANIAALKALFPAAVADGRIDFDTLRQLLGDEVDDGDERYGLNWPGKRRARRLALTPSTGTLRPAREDSVDWDTTRNLMIEGDNLEVLKLLQKSYAGKVKLIYIDPPYNTGNDFVYPDDYKDSLGNYLHRTGQIDQSGLRNSTNPESSGRFHSNWLQMMYPRLILARELLSPEGLIAISSDDAELERVRLLCEEVFGENNFVVQIVWKKRSTPPNDKIIGANHDYITVVCKDVERVRMNLRERSDEQVARYRNPDNHPKGPWAPGDLMANVKGGRYAASLDYAIVNPRTGQSHTPGNRGNWRFSRDKVEALIARNEIFFGDDDRGRPKLKRFLCDVKQGVTYPSIWDFLPFNGVGTEEVDKLFDGETVFQSPKPVGLIVEILRLATGEGDLIIDFFAGSGTTGHAVMEQNTADGAHRRYVVVQLPERLDPGSSDQQAAAALCDKLGKPRTIAELTKERLRRAAAKIRADHPDTQADLGFRAYKLATSNLRAWEPGDDLAADLLAAADNIVQGRSEEDLLTELLLKQGIDLTEPMLTETIAGAPVHAMGGGVLMVCLAPVTAANAETLADGIADWIERLDPVAASTVFFKDAGFENDVAKANVAAILEQRLEDKLLKVRSL